MGKEVWHRWHRCEPWNKLKLPCPYQILKEYEEKPQDEPGHVSSRVLVDRPGMGTFRAEEMPVSVFAGKKFKDAIGRVSEVARVIEQKGLDARMVPSEETYYDLYGVDSFPPTAPFAYPRVAAALTNKFIQQDQAVFSSKKHSWTAADQRAVKLQQDVVARNVARNADIKSANYFKRLLWHWRGKFYSTRGHGVARGGMLQDPFAWGVR